MKTLLWTTLALLLGCAPAASADSIAYIKHGNVWLSTPDGARVAQVTTAGGYADVSQADDGTMIALHGTRLQRLDRGGAVLADFDTPLTDPRSPQPFSGPFDPAVSPDGSKVAYTYRTSNGGAGTGFSHADRRTEWDEPGFGVHFGWSHPVWVDGETTMQSAPSRLPNADVVLEHGDDFTDWFSDTVDNPRVGGGDLSSDHRKLALQTGADNTTLTVYTADGAGGEVHRCFRYEQPASYGIPTWSPDGTRLAWHEADGIHVASVPGCSPAGATADPPLLIAGASEPDWGPADVPATPASPTPPVVTPPAPPAPPTASPVAPVAPAASSGIVKLSFKARGRGKLTAVATAGGRPVGRTTKTIKKPGTIRLSLPVTATGKVTVRLIFKPVRGATKTRTLTTMAS